MLLYLSSNENLNIFDFLKDEQNMLIEKVLGEFSLKKFIIHETRTFNHYRYILIDLNAVKDSISDIIEALKALKIMYNAKIVLFAGKSNIDLLNKIIDEADIYNIIFGKTLNKIKKQIKICISEKGMTKHYAKININLNYDENEDVETTFKSLRSNLINSDIQPTENKLIENKFDFDAKNIKIIVAGVMPRVGTTTIAINIACYLASIGAKVSYTEGNKNNHLESIYSHFFFNNPITNNYFSNDGVDYYFDGNIPTKGYNFNTIDIGVLSNQNLKLLEELGDIKVLCGGTKPYEIREIIKALELVDNGNGENIKLMLPEANLSDIEKKNLEQTLGIKDERIYYAKFSPNLFDGNTNAKIFESILNEYFTKSKILEAL